MSGRKTVLAVCVLAVVCAGSVYGEALWSVGRADGTGAEFALGAKYAEYPAQFPRDAVFSVGRSQTSSDWPSVHPGPGDEWAGAKAHPLRIEFDLARVPRHACRLTIFAVDTQGGGGPEMEVRINDALTQTIQWPKGAGDASFADPKAGRHPSESWVFPGDILHAGRNAVTLTITKGSWLIYDAILLENTDITGAEPGEVEADSTPFFKRVDGVLKQAVRVSVENEGLAGDAKLAVEGIPGSLQKVALAPGDNNIHLFVPPYTSESKGRVVVETPGKRRVVDFAARPERQWKFFVGPSAHTDIGYTDLQEKIFDRHRVNTQAALEACEKNKDFRWNLEVFAQADWFREMGAKDFAVLEKRIAEGRVGLTGLYLNMLTCLCSGEELVRALTPAQEFGRAHNVPVHTAVLTDVPTMAGSMPMLLAQAGITRMVDGVNMDRGPLWLHADKRMIQSPFWWEGLDGTRILTLFTKTYGQAHTIGLRESVAAVEEKLPRWLHEFSRDDYPGDAMYVNGAFWDNELVSARFAEVAEEWNRTWEAPKFILGRPDDYMQYVEEHFAQELPVFRGDTGAYWEDGAASSALETGMAREARAGISVSERWLALAAARGQTGAYAKDKLDAAWRNVLYYDEHTWGAAGSMTQPESEQTVKQWAYKAAYAERARSEARDIAMLNAQAVSVMAGAACKKHGNTKWVLVRNAMSWARDLTVTVPVTGKLNAVRDLETGQLALSSLRGKLLEFVARGVPGLGYRWYTLEHAKGAEAPALLRPGGDAETWETPRFRLHIDAKTGAISSLVELKTGREWVDSASGYGLNQFLYVTGGEGTSLIHPDWPAAPPLHPVTHTRAKVDLLSNTAVRAVLRVTCGGDNLPGVTTDIVVSQDGSLEFENVVKKDATLEREAGYFAFPFKFDASKNVRSFVELPYGVLEVDKEQMPGASREWYAANTFVATGDDRANACIATREGPMFTVGNLVRGLWPASVENNRGTLFAYAFNNYWHTNYKASQGGEIPYAFSLKLEESRFDPVAATRFGWGYAMDVSETSCPIMTRQKPSGAAAGSLFTLSEGPVVLGDLKYGDGGLLVRLYNPSSEDSVARIALPGQSIDGAYKTDLLGTQEELLQREYPSDPVSVKVPARGIRTVSLDLD